MQEKTNTLYVSYFAVREPLVQTQVLPYLREIAKTGDFNVRLLSFEADFKKNWTPDAIKIMREKLAAENIEWHCLPYHRTPSAPATIYDVMNGVRYILGLHRKSKIGIIHARAHIPMLMAMIASRVTKSRTIFDIRGLMADEYADAGHWRENSKVFRFVKWIERNGIKQASHIVVLTNRMRDYLVENDLRGSGDIQVIPCCVDFSRVEKTFDERKSERFELIYAGTATGLYLLPEMGMFFKKLKKRRPDAFFRILTTSPPDSVNAVFKQLNIAADDYAVMKASPNEVPNFLKQAHLGISFRTPTFSQIAASPTKIPEYLACGLPVVSNSGIGDTDAVLEKENVGLVVENFSEEALEKAADDILAIAEKTATPQNCISAAIKYFDLTEIGGKRYKSVYYGLSKQTGNFIEDESPNIKSSLNTPVETKN